MANRGDVLATKARLGFSPKGETDLVVVVQADRLNSVLPSLVVIPLDPAAALYAHHPAAVLVPAAEVGSRVDHVAIAPQIGAVRADRLASISVGRLSPQTMAKLDAVLRLVLKL